MKKLLALAILSTVSLAKPCFGVDWIRDRIYSSSSYGNLGIGGDIGYHYTDSTKFSVGYVIKPILGLKVKEIGAGLGLMTKLHYHHKLQNTDITPYITAGIGGVGMFSVKQGEGNPTPSVFFSYQVGAGINLPLSSRTSVFAGYKMQKFDKLSHGFELGMSFNL